MEVKKEGDRDVWYIQVTTDMLAAGREEFRKALAEIVKEAVARGWMDADRAERWFEKLKKGRMLKEGWPKHHVGLFSSGALEVRLGSTHEPRQHTARDATA